ncbi:hypothetical protein CVU83_01905 [Candidatus Falkowbacteria bacterium HGW-Falkowbacteria-2]|uniref:DUF2341 domain-containing protein n=1 Tax=Candidatus Falkowbacteria bacterium HGW-Falkowbacteria-2 TaxID=2013769 RepID=A0A2N2E0P2_9BACT|nr:MAG: hypothetical protein CVU83_01905 [Candidatus Falkowbacteria bacterium HGW-Falkowbacteria-2]
MIQVKINTVDRSELINWASLSLDQAITNEVDVLSFEYKKYGARTYAPAINDEVELYEGAVKIFGGYISNISESDLNGAEGIVYMIQCLDYGSKLNSVLATKSYQTIVAPYTYRKKITITGQTGAGTGYQVPVLVGESSGAAGANVHVAGHSLSFPSAKNVSGDLRFRGSDGTTELPFWVEKVTGTTPNRVAKIWVKVAADLGSNQDIYLYYGGDATNVSSGDNTFLLFDDFSGAAIDTAKWTISDATGLSVASDVLTAVNNNGRIMSKTLFSGGVEQMVKFKATSKNTGGEMVGGFFLTTTNGVGILYHPGTNSRYYRNDNNWTGLTGAEIPDNVDYLLSVKAYATTVAIIMKAYSDLSTIQDYGTITNTVSAESVALGKRYDDATNTGGTTLFDFVFVKKVVATEPSFNTVTAEESLSGTAWTIETIIDNLISSYAPGFTTNNVIGTFTIAKIVFNEMYLSDCLKKLAEIVKYDWYVDEEKDIHFFPKFTNTAPFNLTDSSGNYINETLNRTIDGTQIVNQVKVRGGESDGELYTDIITVKGANTKAFTLPYKFSGLTIAVDTGAGFVSKTVGQDFKDDPSTKDCLYNFNDKTVKFPAVLADGNKIQFSGYPKVPIKSVISNTGSIATYGLREKIINDPSIVDMTTARKRAKAELLAYQSGSNEISFETYTSGLRAGMVINLDSSRRSTVDNYVIKKITFKTKSSEEFSYIVSAITTNKLQLLDLLQKLVVKDQGDINDSEIAETILTDLSDIDITELIRKVVPLLDQVDLETSESVYKNPLGDGVEPTWVLGPYAPTSVSDPKRVGRLDISLKFY